MARVARTCLRSILKIVNSTLGLVGIAMILYGFWMLRVLQRDMESPSFDDFDSTALCIGVALCLVTCLGHISADSSNGICLSCVSFFKSVAADILLNSDWEKDLPEDPTGRFHDFREFVESNFDFFKWIAMFIILVQGFSILLAMTLRALGPNNGSKYDIDEEYTSARLPLINPHSQTPPYVVGEPRPTSEGKPPYCNLQFDTERHESRDHCRDSHFGSVEELGIERGIDGSYRHFLVTKNYEQHLRSF
ncbi:tetraspanin-19-like isoform X1 [Populus alba x Populus x berolinensis]|uniref:Tetraspanin-19-like isoform X1 n=1 Tax=Populus alba x Populus x berolinensis TaxID=444605 RepID=A0AAD6M7K1_9ROSI|nr:tetraspanin-19-like isoform X1 [Populus alba x Populus x berolinensis]